MRFKSLVFRCVVVNTILSAIACFAIKPTDYNDFDKEIIKQNRVILKGKATLKIQNDDKTITYRKLPSIELWRAAHMADTHTELLINRGAMHQFFF